MRIITAEQAKAEKVTGQVILVTAGNPVVYVDHALFVDGEIADGCYCTIQFDTADPNNDFAALIALVQSEARNDECDTVIVAPDTDSTPSPNPAIIGRLLSARSLPPAAW